MPNLTKEIVAPELGQMSENAEKKADVVEKGEEKAAAPQGSAVSSAAFNNDQKQRRGCKPRTFSTPLRNGPNAASQSHRLRPPQHSRSCNDAHEDGCGLDGYHRIVVFALLSLGCVRSRRPRHRQPCQRLQATLLRLVLMPVQQRTR